VEASREGWSALCPLQRFNHLTILTRRSHFLGTSALVSGIDA
jgi:hypothetical protein